MTVSPETRYWSRKGPRLQANATPIQPKTDLGYAKIEGHDSDALADLIVAQHNAALDRRVYLAGPINGCSDEEANDWRSDVKEALPGFEFVDPMDRDYRGRELDDGVAAEIVDGDKADISTCGVVLAMCPRPSFGTAMEVLYAWERGKRVLVVSERPSPWLVHHAGAVFPTLTDALDHLA